MKHLGFIQICKNTSKANLPTKRLHLHAEDDRNRLLGIDRRIKLLSASLVSISFVKRFDNAWHFSKKPIDVGRQRDGAGATGPIFW